VTLRGSDRKTRLVSCETQSFGFGPADSRRPAFRQYEWRSRAEYFADGISEDIIMGLSKLRWFFVIARNSSFTYKGKAVDVKRVASELACAMCSR